MTLEQLLRFEGEGTICHPWSYLSGPTRMLAQAMLQHLVLRRGMTQDEWLGAITEGGPRQQALADRLFGKLDAKTDLPGFELIGPAAFMQMPAGVFSAIDPEPVDAIFQPFLARRHGTAKALRARQALGGVCPSCAAIGMYGFHTLSSPSMQYWGRAVTKDAVIFHLQTQQPAQSLLLNTLHDGMLVGEAPAVGLPWMPASASPADRAGYEADGRMPFEHHLSASRQVNHIAEAVFPLVRAVRLSAPAHNDLGQCACCGRTDQPMIRMVSLCGENRIFAQTSPVTKQEFESFSGGTKLGVSGILARCMGPAQDHPSIAKIARTKKSADGTENTFTTIQEVDSSGEAVTALPPWLLLMDALGRGQDLQPRIVQQYLASVSLQRHLGPRLQTCVFGISYVSKTNPTPRLFLNARFGAHHLIEGEASRRTLPGQAREIVSWVRHLVTALAESAERIHWDAELNKGALRTRRPTHSRKAKAARRMSVSDPHLATEVAALWQLAFQEIMRLSGSIQACGSPGHVLKQIQESKERLCCAAARTWNTFRNSQVRLQDRLFEDTLPLVAADAYFMQQTRGVWDVVKNTTQRHGVNAQASPIFSH